METDKEIVSCDLCGAKIKAKAGKSADEMLSSRMEEVHHTKSVSEQ